MFILSKDFDAENPREYPFANVRFDEYKSYLKSISNRLPASTREFALADWHFDTKNSKCPHDAWLEHLKIYEDATGERRQNRIANIEIKLLGAWHDGYLILKYKNVANYSLSKSDSWKSHGDWLYDEVRSSENDLVLHEIEFAGQTEWLIECEDIEFVWEPFKNETTSRTK